MQHDALQGLTETLYWKGNGILCANYYVLRSLLCTGHGR